MFRSEDRKIHAVKFAFELRSRRKTSKLGGLVLDKSNRTSSEHAAGLGEVRLVSLEGS